MDRLRVGLIALAPAPFVFAARAGMAVAHREQGTVLGVVTAVAGVLSMLGVVLLLWRRPEAVFGAGLVVFGHFGVSAVLPDLGAGMVYLGTGLLVAPLRPWALAGGALAMLCAPLRPDTIGHLGVASGALVLGIMIVAALDMRHRD